MDSLKFSKLEKFINSSDNFIICGHENPDPDAICSCISLEYLLTSLGKKVICINTDATPINLLLLDRRNVMSSLEEGAEVPDNIEDYNLLIVDTNSVKNIGGIYDLIVPKIKSFFVIDHHSKNDDKMEDSLIFVSASSTCEIIYRIFEYFNVEVPKEIGDVIYAGIIYDSGSFHYPKTSAYTFNIALKIVQNGTDPNHVYLILYEHESIGALRIFSLVISTLKLLYNNQIAVLRMTKEMLKKSGAKYHECSTIINIPLMSHDIKAVVFFKEDLTGVRRISLRSKGDIDVAKLAILCDGGGHKNAAGFKLNKSIKNFKQILPEILNYLNKEIARTEVSGK